MYLCRNSKLTFPRHAINAQWWKWRTIISTKWEKSESINLLECRAILATLKWRMSRSTNLCSRFVHPTDSQVNLGALNKYRSPAVDLQKVVLRVAALCLAASCKMVLGYVPTDLNPSDLPSRIFEKWRRK